MRISTTNRFLTKTLGGLCCAGVLTACSTWASVVTWQPNAIGVNSALSAAKDASKSDYSATLSATASRDYSFQSAAASDTRSVLTDAFNKQTPSNSQADQSLLFASSNNSTRPTTELDEAMAKTFDEDFVSVPTVQFASATTTSLAADPSMASGPGPVPVPEMSALFPIVGLIAAVSCTQILRRRRAAQQNASRGLA